MAYIALDAVDCIVKATAKAVLVRFSTAGRADVWIPRSVCEDGDALEEGDTDVVVQEWFAEREGMI